LFAGGVNGTDAVAPLNVTVPIVGGPGTPVGTTLLDAAERALVPTAFVAVTLHV
jgi:hypothetical protein